MEAYRTTELADCLIISKKFQRAASYIPTEEAVFALASMPLDNMRVQSQGFQEQTQSSEALNAPQSAIAPGAGTVQASNILGAETPGVSLAHLDDSDSRNEPIEDRIAGNFYPDTGDINDLGGVFNSECIPCGFRIDSMGHLVAQTFTSPLGGISEYIKMWERTFVEFMRQILDLVNLFTGMDKYIDLCALIKFLNDFVCLPDLRRMMSALMALLQRSSFEFGGLLNILIQLVGPLLTPFLSNILSMFQQYLLMIIKPLECIINSVQEIIKKFDYNVLFQNIDMLEKHPVIKTRVEDPRDPIKIPFLDAYIDRRDTVRGGGVLDNLSNATKDISNRGIDALGGGALKAENAREQQAVEDAADELNAIRRAGRGVDVSDSRALTAHRAKEKAAKEKYEQALEEKSLSKLGQLNLGIDRVQNQFRSCLFYLIQKLREAASVVEGFFQSLFDEWKKLMGEYVGGNGGLVGELLEKMQLVQLVQLIDSIIEAFENGINCDADGNEIRIENFVPQQQGVRIWTDEAGSLHIQEDSAGLESALTDAIEEMVKAFGPNLPVGDERGTAPSTSSQKLRSLIELTGDPVLDSNAIRVTEALTTPVDLVFKCPLKPTAADADRINQWISELTA